MVDNVLFTNSFSLIVLYYDNFDNVFFHSIKDVEITLENTRDNSVVFSRGIEGQTEGQTHRLNLPMVSHPE